MKKIVITGGHHNSALVVAEELRRRGVEVIWIGHRQAAAGDTNDSAEYREVTAAGFPFVILEAGKLSFDGGVANLIRLPAGFIHAYYLVQKQHPDAILSFGGYLGASVAAAAWVQGIPVYLHEQTVVSGKANRFASHFARRVYLTWESSRVYFPREKSLVVGLPIRTGFLKKHVAPRRKYPRLLILCGKQGSHVINTFIYNNLTKLLESYDIVHQTGTSSVTGDWERAQKLKRQLPRELAVRYHPAGYIGEAEIAATLATADMVIGRSGAHTTYELGLLGKRSVLIPFLATTREEQLQNAKYLAEKGIAVILNQSDLTMHNFRLALTAASKLSPSPLPLRSDAASRLVSDLLGG